MIQTSIIRFAIGFPQKAYLWRRTYCVLYGPLLKASTICTSFMPFQVPSVPFTTEAFEGFATTEGLLSIDEDNLILEFKTKDSFIGLIQSEIKRIEIPLSILTGFEFQPKWFSNKIVVRTKKLEPLDSIPGSKQGVAKLSVQRKDRAIASEFASFVSLFISENQLKRLDEELNKLK